MSKVTKLLLLAGGLGVIYFVYSSAANASVASGTAIPSTVAPTVVPVIPPGSTFVVALNGYLQPGRVR